MKKRILFVVLTLLLTQGVFVKAQKKQKSIYQYSTITSLAEGVYDGNLKLSEFKKHGNFGVGTFNNLDGEMVVINDTIFQVKTDGIPVPADLNGKTPFGNLVYFDADTSFAFSDTLKLADFQKKLDDVLISDNLIYAFKIEGVFKNVKVRSVPAQKKPFPRLIDAVKHQAVFEHRNIKGTILGFKIPKYMDGVNVAGYHFHFISDDRKYGGHLLDCMTDKMKIQIENIHRVEVVLPDSDDFLKKKNINKNEEEIKKIEN
jgi:alpha-acetolactate decarboxylase